MFDGVSEYSGFEADLTVAAMTIVPIYFLLLIPGGAFFKYFGWASRRFDAYASIHHLNRVARMIAATLPASLFAAIPLAIAAGFISFTSPCVLPLVPGYLAFLTGAAGRLEGRSGRARAFVGSIYDQNTSPPLLADIWSISPEIAPDLALHVGV